MNPIVIAIDGPAAAGKSTVAKLVAKKLGYTYVDTGAMYRAVTLFVLQNGLDPKDEESSCALLSEIEVQVDAEDHVFLNGNDVTTEIRSRLVAENVSYIASYKKIRLFLVELQRKMAEQASVVMDGRDIGSYVVPHAQIKIYQNASVKTRAKRRFDENISKGIECTYEEVESEVKKRDYIDSHREFAPLKKSEDAYEIDTSFMSIDEVVQAIIDIVNQKVGNRK